MSVIAWDGRTIAADCQGTGSDMRVRLSKMRRLDDGTILAWTGEQGPGLAMARWYENGAKPEQWPASQNKDDWSRLIVLPLNGKPYSYERYPEQIEFFDDLQAWGAGRDFALGAMAMGADARKAVEVASRFSAVCGFGVEAYDVRAIELVRSGD